MTRSGPLVSVVLPTYNERETIIDVVDDVLEEVGKAFGQEEVHVVVVDDDSPDGTGRFVEEVYATDQRVEVIHRKHDQGLSSAVLDGFRCAAGRYAVCMDADGQHPANRIPSLVQALQTGVKDGGEPRDLVVGSRHVDGGSIEGWPVSRKVTSKVATLLARAFVPAARKIQDPMSGFFAIDRLTFNEDVLDAADPHGYKIMLELAALVPDAKVAEVPITFRDRQGGESKLTLDEQLRFLEHIVGLWFLSKGLDKRVNPPLFVRAVETGTLVSISLTLMYSGLILGNVEGAGGAALIATSGAAIMLALQRLARSGTTWQDTEEVPPKT